MTEFIIFCFNPYCSLCNSKIQWDGIRSLVWQLVLCEECYNAQTLSHQQVFTDQINLDALDSTVIRAIPYDEAHRNRNHDNQTRRYWREDVTEILHQASAHSATREEFMEWLKSESTHCQSSLKHLNKFRKAVDTISTAHYHEHAELQSFNRRAKVLQVVTVAESLGIPQSLHQHIEGCRYLSHHFHWDRKDAPFTASELKEMRPHLESGLLREEADHLSSKAIERAHRAFEYFAQQAYASIDAEYPPLTAAQEDTIESIETKRDALILDLYRTSTITAKLYLMTEHHVRVPLWTIFTLDKVFTSMHRTNPALKLRQFVGAAFQCASCRVSHMELDTLRDTRRHHLRHPDTFEVYIDLEVDEDFMDAQVMDLHVLGVMDGMKMHDLWQLPM